jgi:response regulator RpfG family c-di-GMP phosphodiesterase
MKIMVVDDEQDIKILFEQKFRKEIKSGQIAFLFAFSGEEARDYLKSNGTENVNKILSDINMPGMRYEFTGSQPSPSTTTVASPILIKFITAEPWALSSASRMAIEEALPSIARCMGKEPKLH